MSIEETASSEFQATEASGNDIAERDTANGPGSFDLSSTEMFPPLSSNIAGMPKCHAPGD